MQRAQGQLDEKVRGLHFRDFADEDAISGVAGDSLLLLGLRFENQRM
jgi:hypothetical protein